MEQIRNEIRDETDRVCGTSKGVSPEPIVLTVHSPRVLPLTLVDTPGMARVAVGDQPHDIEARIRSLVTGFISKPGAIILAVTPANQDLATSDAIKLAREADPQGRRTLGVLTKIDLMDAGENALDMLLGRVVPLRLGYIGLVNRSQADVNMALPVSRGLESEARFFASRPEYAAVASHCGTAFLEKRCSELLTAHIRRSLPGLADQITTLKTAAKDELRSYGSVPTGGIEGRRFYLLQALTNVSKAFGDAIDGTRGAVSTQELNAGARIKFIFNDLLRKRLDEVPLAVSTADIRTALSNASGVTSSLFVPDQAFDLLARGQVARLREPAVAAAELVHSELVRVLSALEVPELHLFPSLLPHVLEVGSAQLRACVEPAKAHIHALIDCELAYINTAHPDLARTIAAASATEAEAAAAVSEAPSKPRKAAARQSGGGLRGFFFGGGEADAAGDGGDRGGDDGSQPPRRVREDMSEREAAQVRLIRALLDSYFGLVKKSLADAVPKAIVHFIVARSKAQLQSALLSNLYKDDLVARLLTEDPSIAGRRAALESKIKVLEEASDILHVATAQVSFGGAGSSAV
eukprot:c5002_g1_i1.p1 GENE.c5002_g1_i1~~c5002_g1_i1.p1  ORF type:complete len:639 (+),score=116.23 c5002_g1_i1:180-1919(+)